MNDLRGVEYLPEPTDRSMLSAVDPTVVNHEGPWRSEVMGWAPQEVRPVGRARRSPVTIGGLALFALLVALGMVAWQNQWYVIELPLPDSEWAYESTAVRALQDGGLSGEGVRLCMVDTGVDTSHEALAGANITFKDLLEGSTEPVDYGSVAHGTLMSGLLLSATHQMGVSPNVTFAMVAALRAGSDDANSGTDADVADAIRWCQFEFEADIISLSLGGSTARVDEREGASSAATRQATDAGIFVVAAAGNDGGPSDDGDVASPGSARLAISVGATDRSGAVWANSSIGSSLDSNGEVRASPHQKPEVVAPGVNIISTGDNNRWYSSSGTSDSTVFVAGTLSLLLEAYPHLKPQPGGSSACIEVVKTALMQSVNPNDALGHDERRGYGSLNAQAWYDALAGESTCGSS
jgi:subtilisin family serine protease